jgi:hypothetical protein
MIVLTVRVCTHQQSRVQSSQTHKGTAVTLWLTYGGHHGSAYTPAESSRVPQVLPSQESCCRLFHFRQSDSGDRAWWLLSWGINGCGKVKDHEAIYNASRCEHRNQDYIASIWMKIAQEMGIGKWSTSVFNCLSNINNVLVVVRPFI